VRDLLTMQERIESLFGHASPGWVPPVDLVETDEQYVLAIELPGIAREGITLDFQDQLLTIRGERPAEPVSPERYHQLERGQGLFSRSFRFAAPVLGDHISADLRDGVLTVTVPKVNDKRQIQIS
jgi:HSP20 family protein